MTDPHLIGKRLAFVEQCVEELRALRLDRFDTDKDAQKIALYTLQMAIQAAIDVALHIVSDKRAGEPRSYGDAFILLAQQHVVSPELARNLKSMAGMRNVIAHVYIDLDLREVRHAIEHQLEDLLSFVAAIRPLL